MVEYLTREQLDRLRKLAKAPRDQLLIEVLYQTGCTVSELTHLKAANITDGILQVQSRACIVSRELSARLKEYTRSHDSPYVFPSRQRDRLTEKRVQQIIKGYISKLDKSIDKKTPHLLRYTHIAHAIEKNIPLAAIKEQTGLKDMRLSQIASEVEPAQGGYGRMFG